MAEKDGIDYEGLVLGILESAIKRYNLNDTLKQNNWQNFIFKVSFIMLQNNGTLSSVG